MLLRIGIDGVWMRKNFAQVVALNFNRPKFCFPLISGEKIDVLAITGPAWTTSAAIKFRRQFATASSRRVDHPNVSVLRHTVDRGDVAFGREVRQQSPVRRPGGIKLAAPCVSDLSHFAAQVDGKDI